MDANAGYSCVPLYRIPTAEIADGEAESLPAGFVVEAIERPPCNGQTIIEGRWARLVPGELDRFGVDMTGGLWLRIDVAGVLKVGGRDRPGGQVWIERSLLPLTESSRPHLLPRPADDDAMKGSEESPLSILSSSITDDALCRLHSEGFVVIDNALPAEFCEKLRREMEALLQNEQMWQSRSYSATQGAEHQNILETTLDYEEVPKYAPTFGRMEHDQGLMRQLRRLPALSGVCSQHIRIQFNRGRGACYTMHTDSGTNYSGNTQILHATALFYLNDDWTEEAGGELRLFPFPREPVKIAPKNGRLVLFEPRVVHDVLPNFRPRYCFTLWVSGEESAVRSLAAADVSGEVGLEKAAAMVEEHRAATGAPLTEELLRLPLPIRALLLPDVRPVIVRYVWRHCELEAVLRSHADGQQKHEMLEGIAECHRGMEEMNPRWLLDLIAALPGKEACSEQEADRIVTSELAMVLRQIAPWWE